MAEMFTNDPINWLKWAVVFIVLIGTFIISMKIFKKIGYVLSGEKKVDEARAKGHVIKNARRVDSWTKHNYESLNEYHSSEERHYGTYEYEIDGEIREYHAYFRHRLPPKTITLYYKDNPKKLFCMEDWSWNPFGGMVYLFFIFMPFVLATLTAMALKIPLGENRDSTREDRAEEMLATGASHEGSLTHNGITVHFKTPEVGTGGGEYDWYTYYTDEEEMTDVKVEFGFVDELPPVPEGSRREACVLWGKDMLCETVRVPYDDNGCIREQEQLSVYWQLAEDTYFMVVVNGEDERLSNAYSRLIDDEKFQSSFEISSTGEN